MKINIFLVFFMISSVGFPMSVATAEQNKIIQEINKIILNQSLVAIDNLSQFYLEEKRFYKNYNDELFNEIKNILESRNSRLNKGASLAQTISVENINYVIELHKYNSRASIPKENFVHNFKIWAIKIIPYQSVCHPHKFIYVEKMGTFDQSRAITLSTRPKPAFTLPVANLSSQLVRHDDVGLLLTSSGAHLEDPQPAGDESNLETSFTPDSEFSIEQIKMGMDLDIILSQIDRKRREGACHYNVPYIHPDLLICVTDGKWFAHLDAAIKLAHIKMNKTLTTYANVPNKVGILSPSLITGYASSNFYDTKLKVKYWTLNIYYIPENEKYIYIEECSYQGHQSIINFVSPI